MRRSIDEFGRENLLASKIIAVCCRNRCPCSSIGRGISTISGASDKMISDGNTVIKSHTFLGRNVGDALKDVLLCISSWRSGAAFDAG